jgi:hypothetical protein
MIPLRKHILLLILGTIAATGQYALAKPPEIDITGLGVSIPDGDITPSTADDTDFGSVETGGSVEHTFTISNANKSDPLTLSGSPTVQLAGDGDFTVTAQPALTTLNQNETTTFTVRFAPTGSGTKTATVSIPNNDATENPYNYDIQGTVIQGAAPPTLASPPTAATVEDTTATLGGEVTDTGGPDVTERGIYWSTLDGFADGDGTKVSSTGTWSSPESFSNSVTGLPESTIVYFKSFALNTEGTTYSSQLGFQTEPSTQASGISFSNVGTNSMTINWSASGSGDGVMVVIKQDSAVDVDPTDGTEHAADPAYTAGENLGGANYVLFRGSGSSVSVTGLTPDTTYHVAVYAYAGTGTGLSGINYQQDGPAQSSRKTSALASPPTVANPSISVVEDTSATLGGEVTATNNATITERGIYWSTLDGFTPPGQGTKISSTGTWGTGIFSNNVTGLPESALVYFQAFAVNSAGAGYTAQASFQTEPAVQASGISFSNVSATQMQINWSSSGSGDGVIVVMRQGNAVDTGPADGTEHVFDPSFGSGEELGSTNYVVFRGSGSSVTVSDLTPEATYHVAVYAYAGSGTGITGINYQQDGPARNSHSTLSEFAPPNVDNPSISVVTDTTATLGGEVTFTNKSTVTERGIYWSTTDGFTPPGQGTKVSSSGAWGTGTFSNSVSGLPESDIIYFMPFAVNSLGAGYAGQASFQTEPTSPASGVTFSNIEYNQMQINWSGNGSGDGVIVVLKKDSAVDAGPSDGTEHTANTGFGSGEDLGSANYVVYRSNGSSVVVTGLESETTYYVAVYAYAGSGSGIAGINYKQNLPATGSQITPPGPPIVEFPTASAIGPTTATLGGEVTATNGSSIIERGIYWSTLDGFTPPGQGTKVSSTGTWGTGTFSNLVTGLPESELVYYRALAANSSGEGYSVQAAFQTEPVDQASGVTFSGIAPNAMTVEWSNSGSGDGVLVVVKQGSVVNAAPTDGIEHAVSTTYAVGADLGGTNHVVFRASGSSVNVTGLIPLTTYHVAVYAYAGSGPGVDGINYLEELPATGNATTLEGTVNIQNIDPTAVETTTATLGGNVTGITSGGNVTERGVYWSASDGFVPPGQGTKVSSTGSWGTGSFSENVTGLTQGSMVYFRSFAVNSGSTTYSAQSAFWTEPDVQASAPNFTSIEDTSATLQWTPGNGDGTMVVIRQGEPPTRTPVDGTEYPSDPGIGNLGTRIEGTENYVLHRTSGNSVTITNLLPFVEYYVDLYEYVGTGTGSSGVNYQQDAPATNSVQTLFGQTWMGHNLKFGVSECNICHMTHQGDVIPRGEQQVAVCGQCHNPTGIASNKHAVSLHYDASASTVLADCGDCHEVHRAMSGSHDLSEMVTYDAHTGVTATNLFYFRVETNVHTQALGHGVFHDTGTSTEDYAFTNSAPYNGACQVCHTATDHHTNTGLDLGHGDGKACSDCHIHEDYFKGAVEGGDCTVCHINATDNHRAVMADFGLASTHIPGGAVTTNDCQTCHHEHPDNAYHGNTTTDLRNVDDDSVVSIAQPFARNLNSAILEADVVNLQNNFCLPCHDANGANGDTTPFSTGNPVANIDDALDTANAYFHPVKGPGNNPNCNSTSMQSPWNQGANEHNVISCFDCHGVNAHGSANNNMLRVHISGPTDGANIAVFCRTCHDDTATGSYHVNGDHSNPLRTEDFGSKQAPDVHGPYSCRGCHSGQEEPDENSDRITTITLESAALDIHGGNYTWPAGTGKTGAGTTSQYFINGGWLEGWSSGACYPDGNCQHSSQSY